MLFLGIDDAWRGPSERQLRKIAAIRAETARLRKSTARLERETLRMRLTTEQLEREIERLQLLIAAMRRAQYGRRSERFEQDLAQLELALEELQSAKAAVAASHSSRPPPANPPRRRPLPDHLPRETQTIAPEETACPSCGRELKPLGEDVSEILEYVPASFKVIRQVRQKELPHNTLLNVNIPYLPLEKIKGIRITRLGLRIYRNELVPREDPFGRPYYWIGGESPTGKPEEGTDIGAMNDGYVSITPIHLDMTAHELMAEVGSWEWKDEEESAD